MEFDPFGIGTDHSDEVGTVLGHWGMWCRHCWGGIETKMGIGRASSDARMGLEMAPADRERD